MKTARLFFFLLFLASNLYSQIVYSVNVSEEFKKNYFAQKWEFNPLHVGDVFKYVAGNETITWKVTKDTIVNGKKYFCKVYENHFNWERNDPAERISYKLDVEDLNNNGLTDDELISDNLHDTLTTTYLSFKYIWEGTSADTSTGDLFDTTWASIYGDTVLTRLVAYSPLFIDNWIADKFGTMLYFNGARSYVLNGAIINDIGYGSLISIEKDKSEIPPDYYYISQNYPNPFNPSTSIRYDIKEGTHVLLKVYNTLGEEIETLVNEYKEAGRYTANFKAQDLPSGVYIYRISAGEFQFTRKMLFLK